MSRVFDILFDRNNDLLGGEITMWLKVRLIFREAWHLSDPCQIFKRLSWIDFVTSNEDGTGINE